MGIGNANRLVNIHERVIESSPSTVWQWLIALGSAEDRVWPADRWPPLILSDGIIPGSKGGHGPIRYAVGSVVEGERVRFVFDSGWVDSGFHEFRLEEVPSGTKVVHELSVADPSIVVIHWIMPLHDALLEDLLDQVEALAVGVVVRRAPLSKPVSTRLAVMAAVEAKPLPAGGELRALRGVAASAAATLTAVGVLHAAWGLGSTWPAKDADSLARAVIGAGGAPKLPGPVPCLAVAGALCATGVTAALGGGKDEQIRGAVRPVLATASAALGARAAVGFLGRATPVGRGADPYPKLNLAVYSPLCLALAAATFMVWRGRILPRSS